MDRKGLLVVIIFFLMCYAAAQIFQSGRTEKKMETTSSLGEAAIDLKKVLPPEQLRQFQGVSVYRAQDPGRDTFWRNPSDEELMPAPDPQDPHAGVM